MIPPCSLQSWRNFFSFCCLAFGLLALSGCIDSSGKLTPPSDATVVSTGARRADPGYIQYLERLSMLGSHTELARIVSGSQLAWLRAADAPLPEPLLVLSDTWLYLNPLLMLPETKRSALATITSPIYWQLLSKARINGLYIAPANGSGGLWAYNRKASLHGDDIIQYNFSTVSGKDDEYFRLLKEANTNRKLLGLDLVPAATGLGPDFFLAARSHRQYPGAYCLVELPPQTWPELPAVPNEWTGAALDEEQIHKLAERNILPPAMAQDSYSVVKKPGWAVTGEIHGVDGLMRRWAYRYSGSVDRPVLNWADPSAAARRILSGSAIRNVGMLGGALVGMRLEGLYGLDAAVKQESGVRYTHSPADEAAIALSREIRRYGGWSWLKDEIPLSLMLNLMPNGPDFFQDSIFSPGIEHALLSGSPRLLSLMVDDALALGIDMRRLVHTMPGDDGINYAMPHLAEREMDQGKQGVITPRIAREFAKNVQTEMHNAVLSATMTAPHGHDLAPLRDKRLYTTPAGLAALALGIGNASSVTEDMLPKIRDGHLLQIFFRAMLPGLFMLSGQDIVGTLPLSWYGMVDTEREWDLSLSSRGAYGLTQSVDNISVTTQGMGRAKSIYPTADVQIVSDDSFIAYLSRILTLRANLNIANAKVHGRFVTYSPGSLALATLLPTKIGHNSTDAASGLESNQQAELGTAGVFQLAKEERTPAAQERARMQREEDARIRGELQKQIMTAPQAASNFIPGNGALITVFNFSRDSFTETIDLSLSQTLLRIREKGTPRLLSPDTIGGVLKTKRGASPLPETNDKVTMTYGKKTISVTLPPWHAAAILIGTVPSWDKELGGSR